MSYAPVQVYSVGIASGASTSSGIDLGKSFNKMGLTYVTMTTGALVSVYGSTDNSTFLPVYQWVSTSTVQYAALTVPTSTSGGWGFFDAPPFRYLKFITSAVVSGGVSFTVTASD